MTIIYGHRGAAGMFPENTMVSFKAAHAYGAHGIELDVQMTKDRKIVVIHDETVNRTTDGEGAVCHYSYKELTELDASHFFYDKVGFCQIPTLEEVLRWICRTNLLLNIELKNSKVSYAGLEEEVISLIRQYKMEMRTILSSFNHASIATCNAIAPEIETAVLCRGGVMMPWRFIKKYGATSFHPNYKYIPTFLIKQTLSQKIAVRVYTVNNMRQMRKYIQLGVTALITDYPNIAVRLLQQNK